MSQLTTFFEIQNLDVNQLAEALEFNGYGDCVGSIRTKDIDGQQFLKLTELQISLWRLPPIHVRRFWSFIQHVKQDPTQFLINSTINKKMTPRVNTFNKPIKVNNFLPNKPNIAVKPSTSNQFQKSIKISENSSSNLSTLTKQESQLFKHKLAQMLKTESSETTRTSVTNNQNQPQVPPRPVNMKITVPNKYEEYDESPDGYLAPIKVDPNKHKFESVATENETSPAVTVARSNSVGSGSSFLYKFRKNYEHLEIRHEVIENNYEEQNGKPQVVQCRPLPPIPVHHEEEADNFHHDIELETDDEDLAEYTPVVDEETEMHRKAQSFPKPNSFRKGLLPVTQDHPFSEDDEELAEYTSVLEDDEIENSKAIKSVAAASSNKPIRNPSFNRPLPPTPVTPSFAPVHINDLTKRNSRAQLPIPDSNHHLQNNHSTLPKTSVKLAKPRADLPKSPSRSPTSFNTLPKPPSNLPKPPFDLLDSTSQDDLPSLDFNAVPTPQKRRLPIPPVEKVIEKPAEIDMTMEDELQIYSEIDLALEPNYRETDRKGARRLLSGLPDGAYVIRPSRKDSYICTFSIMRQERMFNLGIEKNADGTFIFGSVASDFEQPKFHSVSDIIRYYSTHALCLSGEAIILRDILPRSRR